MSTNQQLSEYLDFITETAYLAGRLTLAYYQTGVQPEFKPDDTPVTAADRKAEELIRGRIERRYPGHAILGEEFGEDNPTNAGLRWIIDPIDGTKSFVQGVPLYAVLIGLEVEGKVEVGCAYFPALDEIISAATGFGCWWNGRRAHVSKTSRLDQAVVAYTSANGFYRGDRQTEWERLQQATRMQRGWSDAYGYMLAATGRVDIMLDSVVNTWDCAPFPPIFAEAGGYYGDWQGYPTIYGREALATNPQLLPQLIKLFET